MSRENLEARLNDLTRRADRINQVRAKLEKEEAIKGDRYEEALKELKNKFGIDASSMKGSELKTLLADTEEELLAQLDTYEAVVEKSETAMAEFRRLQGA